MKLTAKDRVRELLEQWPHLRDEPAKLVATFHLNEVKRLGYNPNEISAFTLLKLQANGRLTLNENITRCSRKLQEENPELRGSKWVERRTKRAQEVKKQIKEGTWS